MATSNVDEAMKAHAMEAVAAAARHDVVLDYSERSLADVDELLRRESFVGKTPRAPESHDDGEALWACSKMMGAYLGEVVLRALGGHWVEEGTEHGEPRPAIQVGEVRDYPVDKIWRRLTRAASRPLGGYCDQVRASR